MFDAELRAALFLKSDLALPLDLVAQLINEGFIIAELEQEYRFDTSNYDYSFWASTYECSDCYDNLDDYVLIPPQVETYSFG